jgi:hypothetical protein
MDKARNCLLIFGLGIIAVPAILLLAGITKRRCRGDTGDNADKSMYEKLRESKMALIKATSLIQSALGGMLNRHQ